MWSQVQLAHTCVIVRPVHTVSYEFSLYSYDTVERFVLAVWNTNTTPQNTKDKERQLIPVRHTCAFSEKGLQSFLGITIMLSENQEASYLPCRCAWCHLHISLTIYAGFGWSMGIQGPAACRHKLRAEVCITPPSEVKCTFMHYLKKHGRRHTCNVVSFTNRQIWQTSRSISAFLRGLTAYYARWRPNYEELNNVLSINRKSVQWRV